MKTQSEATINAVVNLAKELEIEATPYETVYSKVLSSEQLQPLIDMLTVSLIEGAIGMSPKSKLKFLGNDTEEYPSDHKALRRYVVGLVNDRMRKAKALNGNIKYEHKEVGKLINSRDPQLKALNQVLALETTLDEDKPAILQAITTRKEESVTEKMKKDIALTNGDYIANYEVALTLFTIVQ